MEELLNLFGMLSDKTRLRILLLLLNNELCVCEIFAALNMSQPRVSRQLALLKQARLIKDRREGKWIYYRIERNEHTDPLLSILPLIAGWLRDDTEFTNDISMIGKISELKSQTGGCGCMTPGGEDFGKRQ